MNPVGLCTNCNKTARWNTPSLSPDNAVWCDGCVDADRSNTLFRHIDQSTSEPTGGFSLNGCIVWADRHAWVEGGSRGWPASAEEKKLSPEELVKLINNEYNVQGLTRCTGCSVKMKPEEIAGRPLFAGIACAPCWAKHNQDLKDEAARGHVCSFCRKPYGACYC